MDFYEAVQRRRSIRRFKPEGVPASMVEEIVNKATEPFGEGHAGRYRVVAISSRETIEQMRDACIETIEHRAGNWTAEDEAQWAGQNIPFPKHDRIGATQRDHYRYFSRRFDTFFGEAPVVLAMVTKPFVWKGAPHAWPTLQLMGAVMQAIQLVATEKGLGSCCMTGPLHSRDKHAHILGLEPPWGIAALLPLGVPASEPAPRPRKTLMEVLGWLRSSDTGVEAAGDEQEEVEAVKVELAEVLGRSRNVYHFRSETVPEAEVREVIRVARLAPNSLNQQKWRFIAITARDVLEEMRRQVLVAVARLAQQGDETRDVLDALALLDWPPSDGERARDLSVWEERTRCLCEAPVVVAVLNRSGPPGPSTAGWSDIESIGCAVETMMLSATARGYGSCWMTSPLVAWQHVDKVLGVQDPWRTVALVPVGRPLEAGNA